MEGGFALGEGDGVLALRDSQGPACRAGGFAARVRHQEAGTLSKGKTAHLLHELPCGIFVENIRKAWNAVLCLCKWFFGFFRQGILIMAWATARIVILTLIAALVFILIPSLPFSLSVSCLFVVLLVGPFEPGEFGWDGQCSGKARLSSWYFGMCSSRKMTIHCSSLYAKKHYFFVPGTSSPLHNCSGSRKTSTMPMTVAAYQCSCSHFIVFLLLDHFVYIWAAV